ncbi:hypothetical protein [Halosimplex pelagicum]|uniref:Uncharacterized protein n=1 Tax=Halosimplex pelagicum TaxID=869886 RepID=A0A7D5PAG1_9EURY|nr:hypothetical protein [Halosimplex pelagicum]QLH81765.1 hypothetical protein HZS54_09060 [Halosimplex pelagicum]
MGRVSSPLASAAVVRQWSKTVVATRGRSRAAVAAGVESAADRGRTAG